MTEEEEIADARLLHDAWVKHGLKITVDLVKLDPTGLPLEGACSGFLIERNGKTYVLSAGHGLGKGDWFLQTNVVDETAASSINLPMNGVFTLKSIVDPFGERASVKRIDFAWCEVNLAPLREEMKKKPYLIQKEPLQVHDGPLNTNPLPDTPYSYAAHNRAMVYSFGKSFREQAESFETFMEYAGETESGLYRFKLEGPHQGHAYYEGASGSPIFDQDGTIVSLLLRGVEGEDFLYGLPLSKYEACVGLGDPI